MGLATSTGVGSGRFLRVLVAIAVAAAVLMIIPPVQGDPVDGTIGFAAATSNAPEGTPTHTVFVELSVGAGNTLDGGVTVSVTAIPDTATTPADFTLVTNEITFLDGAVDSTLPVTIDIENDTIFEGNETFTLELDIVTGTAALGQSTHIVTILDNDSPPSLSVNSPSAVEEGDPITFTVTMSNPSSSTVTVNYATANGSAAAPGDYTAVSGTLTFTAGETSKPVVVNTINDNVFEGTETFTLVLSSPVGGTLGTAIGTGTITDNDSPPSLSVNSPSAVEEGDPITFTVTMSNPSSSTVTVNYATANGSAAAPGDYTAVSGTLTFTAGETSKPVVVNTINDNVFEGTETFTLVLSSPVGGTLGTAIGTGTITDNDSPPSLSVNSPSAVEEGDPITFTVTMSNPSSSTVTVNYATANGSAAAPGDYTAVSGTLTFTAGETSKPVVVNTINDALFEATETFTLVLSSPVGGTLGTAIGTGTILDNDGPPGISALDATANEGDGVIQFQVVLLPAAGSTRYRRLGDRQRHGDISCSLHRRLRFHHLRTRCDIADRRSDDHRRRRRRGGQDVLAQPVESHPSQHLDRGCHRCRNHRRR
jgi:hypothetical protein